ncbi:DUF3987 domain-containing protein [Tateyamaria sp.]|uniref:DUF3987 domain-containing protein n=1 Tax=Tateyamaria sp. TaxID=1929288 RepID=UPI00329B3F8C
MPYWAIDNLPSGIVQDMAQHVMARQKFDMPMLAVLAGFTALATVSQNAFAIEYGLHFTPLNIYSIGVGRSASGKEAGRQLVRLAGDLVSPSVVGGKLVSERALFDTLQASAEIEAAGTPMKTLLWDEVWQLFEALSSPNPSAHTSGMLASLLEVYNGGTSSIAVPERAARNNTGDPVLYGPFVSIMGTTTKERLFASMNDTFLRDGLVGRTMFVAAPQGPRKPFGYDAPANVPEALLDALTAAAEACRGVGMAFATGGVDTRHRLSVQAAGEGRNSKQFVRVHLSRERRIRLEQFADSFPARFGEGSPIQTAVSRASDEQVLRIAGLLAVGRMLDTAAIMGDSITDCIGEFGVEIDDACLDYAIEFVSYLMNGLAVMAGEFDGGSSPAEKQKAAASQKIIEAARDPENAPVKNDKTGQNIRRALREGWVTQTAVSRILRHTFSNIRDEVMQDFVDRGEFLEPVALPDHLIDPHAKKRSGGTGSGWALGWRYAD